MRENWLREFLELPNGIPSHDTFNRVFSRIDPSKLEDCLQQWVKDVFQMEPKGVISIDGKSVRGSAAPKSHKYVHMISAWSHEAGMVLGQLKVDEKTNEIMAIPQLLDKIDIEGSIVTMDAMGCQKNIVSKIIEKKGDYIIALKGNQGKLKEEAADATKLSQASACSTEIDYGHGRIEKRTVRVYRNITQSLSGLWVGLSAAIRIDATRYDKIKKTEQTEIRYYITSLKRVSAAKIGEYIRQHWEVENKLHW
ncbi:MAG: ISAs1 family transposase, partial [Parabacteroides sp.]|nr:ISAs1 family transposase [Parabacteroides sp.]